MTSPFPFVANQVLTAAELNELEPQLTAGLGYAPLSYYTSTVTATSTATASVVNTGTFALFYVSVAGTFDRITVNSGAAVTNPTTVRLGIYNNSGNKPSTLVLDAGTVTVTAINTVYEITISQTLDIGWYWLCAANQTAASVTNLTTGTSATGQGYSRYATAGATTTFMGWTRALIDNPFPATVVGLALTNTNTPIFVQLRKA